MSSKRLAFLIAVGGTLLVEPTHAQPILEVVNMSPPSTSVYGNSVDFIEDVVSGPYLPNPSPPSVEIYYQDTSSNKYSVATVTYSPAKAFPCPLAYQGTVPNGSSNQMLFYFIEPYPTNTLINAKILTASYTNAFNVKKAVADNSGTGTFTLPTIHGAVDGQIYGTATVYFASLTAGQIKSIQYSSNATLTMNALIQLATSNTLQCTTNSLSDGWATAFAVTNFYAAPNIANIDSGWMNLTLTAPAPGSNAFYRIVSTPAYP